MSRKITMNSSVLHVFTVVFVALENPCSERVIEIQEFRLCDGFPFLSGAFNQLLAALETSLPEDQLESGDWSLEDQLQSGPDMFQRVKVT